MKVSQLDFVRMQRATSAPVLTADLSGKTVMVLGASTGLGEEAAKHFARMKPGRLILACRSEARGKAAADRLQKATGYTKSEVWLVDLADFASTRAFCDKFEGEGGRLDILVENAGIMTVEYEPTKDGWESSIQVNDLSTPLVAFRLLPILVRTAQEFNTTPRIVVVASGMHYWVTLKDKVIQSNEGIIHTLGSAGYGSKKSNLKDQYSLTKLLNVFFVRAFNAHLPSSTPVTITAVCPGFCHSDLGRSAGLIQSVFMSFGKAMLARSTEQGSRQLVYASLAHQDTPKDMRGAYAHYDKVDEPSDFVLSKEGAKVQQKLWDELVGILSEVDPKVPEIVKEFFSA